MAPSVVEARGAPAPAVDEPLPRLPKSRSKQPIEIEEPPFAIEPAAEVEAEEPPVVHEPAAHVGLPASKSRCLNQSRPSRCRRSGAAVRVEPPPRSSRAVRLRARRDCRRPPSWSRCLKPCRGRAAGRDRGTAGRLRARRDCRSVEIEEPMSEVRAGGRPSRPKSRRSCLRARGACRSRSIAASMDEFAAGRVAAG